MPPPVPSLHMPIDVAQAMNNGSALGSQPQVPLSMFQPALESHQYGFQHQTYPNTHVPRASQPTPAQQASSFNTLSSSTQ